MKAVKIYIKKESRIALKLFKNFYENIVKPETNIAKYSNGRINRVKSFLGFRSYPKVEAGSEIIVPTERIEKITRVERLSISTAIVSMSVVLVSFIRLFTN